MATSKAAKPLSIFDHLLPQPKFVNRIDSAVSNITSPSWDASTSINVYIPKQYEIYKYDIATDSQQVGWDILVKPITQFTKSLNAVTYESDVIYLAEDDTASKKTKMLDIELVMAPIEENSTMQQIKASTIIPTEDCEKYAIQFKSESLIRIISPQSRGLFYGIRTLSQVFQLSIQKSIGMPINICIFDYPAIPNRGIMLDITRCRVPTMDQIKALISMLASFKYNQLQLYCEHAFQYKEHQPVWENASPISGAELCEIDKYCAAHHICLVPNQNTLGHMHRWLKHPEYKHLAECPDGNPHPFSLDVEPYSLNVTDDRSFKLATSLLAEMQSHVRCKSLINVNLDEVFDLGLGRSSKEWKSRGSIELYLSYLNKLLGWCGKQGIQHMMCWGDFYHNRPETVSRIPKNGCTILEWGYDDWHPFLKNCKRFDDENIPFYVCPGTSTWASFAGRTKNTVRNVHFAAIAAQTYSANCKGFLMTDWGDLGHPNPPSISYLPYIIGADAAWGKLRGNITDSGNLHADCLGSSPELQGERVLSGSKDVPSILEQNWTLTSNIAINILRYVWEHMFLGKFFVSIFLILPGLIILHVLVFALAILSAPFGHRGLFCKTYQQYINDFNAKYKRRKDQNESFEETCMEGEKEAAFSDEPGISARYVETLNIHVFKHDTTNTLGKIAFLLGNSYLYLGNAIPNGTLLFWGIMMPHSFFDNRILRFIIEVVIDFPLLQPILNIFGFCFGRFCGSLLFGITKDTIIDTKIRLNYVKELLDDVTVQIAAKEIQDEETILVVQEMRWVADVLLLSTDIWLDRLWIGVHNPLSLLPLQPKTEKAQRLDNLISRHKELWLKRSRPGGLEEGIKFLTMARDVMTE